MTARALVVQHVAAEGPGRFAEWLPANGVALETVHPYAGDELPEAIAADALIVMGGPMSAYDDNNAPWLPAVRGLLASAVSDGVPALGVCLGAQLLAVAAGGTVERGAHGPEIGLGEVEVNTADQLLDAGSIPVVQWHYDTVTQLPPGAELLASSRLYPVQAFRVGTAAWGLQYHVEAAPDLIAQWARAEHRDEDGIVAPLRAVDAEIATAGAALACRFAEVIRSRQ